MSTSPPPDNPLRPPTQISGLGLTPGVDLEVDCAIFGGGVAGLWILARLQTAGLRSVLLETEALGSAQTVASQGIIHGGTKYALDGVWSKSAEAVAAMPARWQRALAGEGEVDLRSARVLADHQLFWTTGSIASGVTAFVAGNVVRGRMQRQPRDAWPPVFNNPGFRGDVFQLDEPVLDIPSVVRALARQYAGSFIHLGPVDEVEFDRTQYRLAIPLGHTGRRGMLRARHLIFAAGAGNERLLARMSSTRSDDRHPRTQRRPLHMALLRGRLPAVLHAHCLGVGASPRVTITTHPTTGSDLRPDAEARQVWYLGGDIAERGVERSELDQIRATRAELREVLPGLDLSGCEAEWSTFHIDRAEPFNRGRRPASSVCHPLDDWAMAVWPTKLALAPHLADEVLERVGGRDGTPDPAASAAIAHSAGPVAPIVPADWPVPPVAVPPWQEGDRRWIADRSV